jgi:hypothetical protein
MAECRLEENKKYCNCTYSCGKHGMCCTCLRSHIQNNEVPACFFPKDAERTYDRSVENFIRIYQQRGRIG